MPYDVMIFTAHPDDAEVQMGCTIVKLARKGLRVLIVDLTDGEPADYAEPGVILRWMSAMFIISRYRHWMNTNRSLSQRRTAY